MRNDLHYGSSVERYKPGKWMEWRPETYRGFFYCNQSIIDMTYNYEQGKDHKVAATQETTAQNAEIQSYFNGINREQLYAVCEALSATYSSPGGLQFNPSYFQNYLEMTNKFIQGAKMGEDKRNMVLNAFHFVCDALLASVPKSFHYIANAYYPQDLFDRANKEADRYKNGEIREEDLNDTIGELTEDCLNEIATLTGDLWELKGQNVDEDDLADAFNLLDEYSDFIDSVGRQDEAGEIWADVEKLAEALNYEL